MSALLRDKKSIFNGPGGSQGASEVDKDLPCAWQLIVDRYKEMNMLDKYLGNSTHERLVDKQGWWSGRVRRDLEDMSTQSNLERVLASGLLLSHRNVLRGG